MEAEFGRFFLADYQCGNQQWPSAAEHAKQQRQQLQQSLQPAQPLESQPLGAQEELPGGASRFVQQSPPAATSVVPPHSGNLGSSRAEHGAENGKEIDSAASLDVGTTSLEGQSGGQGASGHLLTGPDESPKKPERLKVPEADPATSSRGRCVSFDTDGRGPSVDKATASVSSAALTTINYEAQVPGLVTSPTTVQKHAEIDAQVQRALDLLFADERLCPSVDKATASVSSTALTSINAETQVPGSVTSPTTVQKHAEIDAQVQHALDLLFADERLWQLISTEVSKSMRLRATLSRKQEFLPGKSFRFRVQVPKPYPGVQYRKSKDLNDKYPRYAKHGSTIVGEVEADSEWVKVREMYLPMRLGPVQILELMPETRGGEANGRIHVTQ
eukprot:CAMPEP_0172779206 /NCGR_PEP_ID=MMETSP1074-20121228/202303_1 /TAXON_ID=2916 /ORGANISM="Ceratium fusus, Strain PA161109" /LENGTH=387 /DNA_ID=CAMNT_0013616163 /DNA_START=82 /DNA_END=1245 /DNA_ORIENTATION=-